MPNRKLRSPSQIAQPSESSIGPFTLREETPNDVTAIHQLTKAAFLNAPHTSHTEQFVVDALREAGALSLSVVALQGNDLVGHIAASPVEISDGSAGWFGLGPLSVLPRFQRQGIGSALVRYALDALRARGAAGCVLLGDPAYYARFGFAVEPKLVLPDVPPEYFQVLRFDSTLPSGTIRYHEAFASSDPEPFMQEALALARENLAEGGRPFGAVIVYNGEVIARGANEIHRQHDPTAHAELLAIRRASQQLRTSNLAGCVVYASGHPCPMCLAAMHLAGIRRGYYAYSNEDAAPFGLSSAAVYAQMALPPSAQSLALLPLRPSGEDNLYGRPDGDADN